MRKKNALIIGSAGRDFHNFNTYFKDNDEYNVVGFTGSQQVPGISGRKYPAELAGGLYTEGIPIYAEEELPRLIKDLNVDCCVFSYSDATYQHVMGIGAIVNAAGANYMMLGPNDTMLKSKKPVIAVCAVRTGAGKSQTSRRIVGLLMERGLTAVAVRHPMPYGDLVTQRVQRFAELSDLEKHQCTIEEMEEYEPYIVRGNVIYAGVDYAAILGAVEEDPKGCDVVLWDGGNNDFPFYQADLEIVVADPHRPGHELEYYPGEVNFKRADVIVINKIDTADLDNILELRENIGEFNKDAIVVDAASPIFVEGGKQIRNKRVLVIEDGPTLTHGEMEYGAGVMAAYKYGAAELVDPREYAVGTIAETYEKYPEIGILLPAMGYGEQQMKDLEATINKVDADLVIIGTPIDLGRIVNVKKPTLRVTYELEEIGTPTLEEILKDKFNK